MAVLCAWKQPFVLTGIKLCITDLQRLCLVNNRSPVYSFHRVIFKGRSFVSPIDFYHPDNSSLHNWRENDCPEFTQS